MLALIAWRNVRAHPTRFVGVVLAIVLATTFLSVALTLRDSLSNALTTNAVAALGDVDLAIEPTRVDLAPDGERPTQPEPPGGDEPSPSVSAASPPGLEFDLEFGALDGVDREVVDDVATVDGVAAALGQQSAMTGIGTGDRAIEGTAWVVVESPILPWQVSRGRLPTASGEVALDEGSAAALELGIGDEVGLATRVGFASGTIVGLSRFGDQSARSNGDVLVTPADGESWTGLEATGWDQVLVDVADDAVPDEVRAAVADVVGDGGNVITGDELRDREAGAAGGLASGLGIGLQAFAYLALVVGALIIFNTFTTIVGQRTREFALLRAIGTSARQVRRAVRVEAVVVAAVASVIGLLLGIALVAVAQALIPALDDLSTLTVRPWSVLQVLASGLVVTVVAAFIPAWRASRTRPVEALRDADPTTRPISRARTVTGLVLLAVGAVVLVVGSAVGGAILLGLGATLLFVGVLVAGPTLVAGLARLLRGPAQRLSAAEEVAVAEVDRNARRTAATANALVIGVFLVVFVTAAGGALRDFAVQELEALSGADLSVTAVAMQEGIPQELRDEVDGVAGVAEVAEVYGIVGSSAQVFDGGMPAAAIDFARLEPVLGVTTSQGEPSPDGVIIGLEVATRAGVELGDVITMDFLDGQQRELEVVGLSSLSLDVNPLLVDTSVVRSVLPDLAPTNLALRYEDGVDTGEVRDAVEQVAGTYGGVQVIDGNSLVTIVRTFFNLLISAVSALLGVAVVMALFGILNTLVLAIAERTRELGLLRAVGMTRAQLRRMVRTEALVTSMVGTTIGAVFGVAVAYAATRPVLEGTFTMPWLELAVTAVAGVAIGVLASIFPAWRAARQDPLDAIRNG